ncbi:hypothetical protein [Nocardioides sp.]|uniref:hypothetical protein n=1 Tax=Nocardioides sp. TaxID=35761 RepID=UPI00321C1AEF
MHRFLPGAIALVLVVPAVAAATSTSATADPSAGHHDLGQVSRAVSAQGPRLVRPAKIGKAKVGMTVEEAMATGQFRRDVPNPPCDPIELQPTKRYRTQYVVFVADGQIVEMNATGDDMATPTGSRIYSTYKRIKRDYGSALSRPREVGFGQWGVFLHRGKKGANRRWLGFLFGEASVEDGRLGANDVVTMMGVTKGKRPPLILDGC